MADILDIVRDGLRRKTKALDNTELIPMIAAAKTDLASAGIKEVFDNDPLTQIAIKLFCQYLIEKDPTIKDFYDGVKNGMALDSMYTGGDIFE